MSTSTPPWPRSGRTLVAALTVAAACTVGVVTSSAPAAAACEARWLAAGTTVASSEDEIIHSGCLNALAVRRGGTAQRYRGRYWDGSTWRYPTAGYIYRDFSSTNHVVLLSDVVPGTHIRVQAEDSNATAESVF